MRTAVTHKSFLWRGKVQLCCLIEDHQGSNSKVKAALGEQEFTRDGKQPVWKNSFETVLKVIVSLFSSSPSTWRSQALQSHVGAHAYAAGFKLRPCASAWLSQARALFLTPTADTSLILEKLKVLALQSQVKTNCPSTTLKLVEQLTLLTASHCFTLLPSYLQLCCPLISSRIFCF